MNSSIQQTFYKYKVESERKSKGRVFYIELSVHGNHIVFSQQNGLANPPRYTCAPLLFAFVMFMSIMIIKKIYIVDS